MCWWTLSSARAQSCLLSRTRPEFGAGATTFNDVFGRTRNPWDTRMTSGGSSGGAAAALAAGQVWLATGSDLGGSLRIPASFCGVVGLRPSPGRVPSGPKDNPFGTLSVDGPMGRTVGDAALFLDAMAGFSEADPLTMPAPGAPLRGRRRQARRAPAASAYTPDLGISPVQAQVREVCAAAVGRFEAIGARVDEATMDFTGANDVFHVLRAHQFLANLGPVIEEHGDLIKPEIHWNVEAGRKQTVEDVAKAERARAALFYRAVEFFETYDLLVAPTVIVPPFDAELRYVTDVDGVHFDDYISWLVMCSALVLTGCPVIAVPVGFTSEGLPVGVPAHGAARQGRPAPLRRGALRAGCRPGWRRAHRPAPAGRPGSIVETFAQPRASSSRERRGAASPSAGGVGVSPTESFPSWGWGWGDGA